MSNVHVLASSAVVWLKAAEMEIVAALWDPVAPEGLNCYGYHSCSALSPLVR